jgi:flagellar biosynthesis protein FlhF
LNTSTSVNASASKIVAPSSREALRLIREQLGPDAIILSNRVTDAGVEIVAIAEDAAAQISASAAPVAAPLMPMPIPAPAASAAYQAAAIMHHTAPPLAAPPPTVHTDSVLSEIHSMRGMIEEQLAGLVWSEKQKRDPVRGHLLRTLLGAGFSARLAKAMLDHLPIGGSYASGMAWVKSELTRNLPVLENENALMDGGGVYALTGPTGVGKTTTTAKLAARCVMHFGPEKLALLTTDSYRIGAYEQLRIYGQILGVSVHAVRDAADLRLVLHDLRHKHMVLIDTVGMSQRDRTVSEQVAMLCGAGRPVKRLLLLNAASHGDTLNEVVHAYRHSGTGAAGNELAGCIFTKLDEATHPGALLDTVIRHRLPVHYISSGQKVPENLEIADRAQLVDSVFQAGSRSALFVPGEADLDERPAPLSGDAEAAAAQAAATAERLQTQCQLLIRALAYDAQELSANAMAMTAGHIGFDGTRTLWRNLNDDAVSQKTIAQTLLSQARAEVHAGCTDYVLALTVNIDLSADDSGDMYALHGSLLLSDRSGMPLAAPNQVLTTAAAAVDVGVTRKPSIPAMRQIDWLRRQDFGKPVLHWMECMPTPGLIRNWQNDGIQWAARGRAGTSVVAGEGDTRCTLAKLAEKLSFSTAQAVMYKGKKGLQSIAEAPVTLCISAKNAADAVNESAVVVRCIVMRIVDQHKGKVLAQWYLLSNIGKQFAPHQIAQWSCWRSEVEPYAKLLKQGVIQLGGCGQPGDSDMLKRLLIAGQAGTTVWRLQHAQGNWAEAARKLLTQLAGRQDRPGKPVAGTVLFEGLGKLYMLLDALDGDNVAIASQATGMATVQG